MLLSCFVFCMGGKGQPVHQPVENAYNHSGAYSSHFMDVFSFSGNPSCLGSISHFSAGILMERKWMMKELDNEEVSAVCKAGNAGLGLALKHNGDKDYSEQAMKIAIGKNLGRLELGIQLDYLLTQAGGYQAVGFGSSGIGLRLHISEKFITGWELGLPVFGRTGKTNPEAAPRFFRMGFGYEWSNYLYLAVQIEKVSGIPLNLISSIEYRYGEQFSFSFGMNSRESIPYFKSGWKKNGLCIQIYTIYEPVLGFSPGLLLCWESKNRN